MGRLRDRACIWCGGKGEYRCLVTRARESSFRHAIRFELCPECAMGTLHQLGRLLGESDHYLYRELVPRDLWLKVLAPDGQVDDGADDDRPDDEDEVIGGGVKEIKEAS